MNLWIKKIVDNREKDSYANNLRRNRFKLFIKHINNLKHPVKILDIGGTQNFWENMNFINNKDIHITLLNIKKEKTVYPNFDSLNGDACNLKKFKDKQ